MGTQEKDWREMFQVEAVNLFHLKTETVGDCNANCLEAKELVCACKCKGRNHGAALRKDVKPLDNYPVKKSTIDTSLFAKICAESMEEARGEPFAPTKVKLGKFYGEKETEELAVLA